MSTYYKYAERNAGSQVNWAEIGKNLTETLQEENRIREEKKAAIDEASRQYGITLEKSPQGDNTTLNQWGLDFAAQAQEARLLQDRLLKSGKLKLRDYTMMRQNLTDGTTTAFGLIDEYNAEYKEKMERAKGMDPANASQYLESWLMAQTEGFANFKQSKLYINPTNFAVSVAKNKVKDGVEFMSNDPNDYTTVNELRNRIKARYDKFDSDAFLKGQVDLLGEDKRAEIARLATESKAGILKVTEDVTAKENWEKAQSSMLDIALSNPTNVSSILTDNLHGITKADGTLIPFTFTFDPKAAGGADGNVIYLENIDGTLIPKFTEEQRALAKGYLKQKMDVMLDYKEAIDTYNNPAKYHPSVEQQRFWKEEKNLVTGLQQWNKLRTGSLSEKAAAAKYFAGTDEAIKQVRFTKNGGGVEFVYAGKDGAEDLVVPYYFYDTRGEDGGELNGPSWMAVGNEMFGGKLSQDLMDKYGTGKKTKHEGEEKIVVSVRQDGGIDTSIYSTKPNK